MKEYKTLEIELSDRIFTIRLNRPEKHNAINKDMLLELIACFDDVSKSDAIALVLRGNGKSFCAGADLNVMKDVANQDRSQTLSDSILLCQCFKDIYHCEIPTIAIAHGSVFGGAGGLLAACDIAYCADDSTISFSEIKIGLVPACVSPYIIKRIGEFPAKELMLTGRKFNGKEAERIGLANKSVPFETLDNELNAVLEQLKTSAPNAMKECKSLIYKVSNSLNDQESFDYTAKLIANIRHSQEAQEGMSAFLEKRKPNWVK